MEISPVLPTMVGEREATRHRAGWHAQASVTMRVLCELIPWAGYSLSAWNPGSGTHRHVSLVTEGYSEAVRDHLNDSFVESNPAFHLLHTRVPRALRWVDVARDWDIEFGATQTAEEFLIPAGFSEGTTMCLRLANGRYTGSLHLNWASPQDASDEVRDIIERFRPLLAIACDLLSESISRVDQFGPETNAILVSNRGRVSEVPGRSVGPIFAETQPIRRMLANHAVHLEPGTYLHAAPSGQCHRIEIMRCPDLVHLVTERTIPWPFGLSVRETGVLTHVAGGWSNPDIARMLGISPRTVSTHVERILRKLHCHSRAELAAVAAQARLLLIEDALGTGL